MRTYATSKELKTKEIAIKSQNINQAIGMQLIIILKIKLRKYIFKQNMTSFSAAIMFFEPP